MRVNNPKSHNIVIDLSSIGLAAAIAVAGFAILPTSALAQAASIYQGAVRAYPYVSRWVQSPSMPYTVQRLYRGAQNYVAPRQYYYAQPQWALPRTTPMYTLPRY